METENKKRFDLKKFIFQSGLYIFLVFMIIAIMVKEPSFLSLRNFQNILTQSSVRLIIALGAAGLIVTTGTDLSIGRQVGFAAVISATLLQAANTPHKVYPTLTNFPIIGAILIVMFIGIILGGINGLIVAKLNVHPFIATLGTMTAIYGINSLYYDYSGGSPISGFSAKYSKFAQGYFAIGDFKLTYLIIYAIIATIIMWILWNKTKFGKNVFAIGGNVEAAKVSGVNVTWTLVKLYALSGIFYGFGGFLEAGRIGSATNNLGFMYELDAIAACVIGGVSFYGGIGKISGVVLGVLTLTIINYGLTYVGVNPYWQFIIKGVIIIGAVAFDAIKYAKKK